MHEGGVAAGERRPRQPRTNEAAVTKHEVEVAAGERRPLELWAVNKSPNKPNPSLVEEADGPPVEEANVVEGVSAMVVVAME